MNLGGWGEIWGLFQRLVYKAEESGVLLCTCYACISELPLAVFGFQAALYKREREHLKPGGLVPTGLKNGLQREVKSG